MRRLSIWLWATGVDLDKLLNLLPDLGYERVDLVEGRGRVCPPGRYSGCFPMTAHRPSRLEFFDDEVDSIRRFNISTQRTEERQPPWSSILPGTGGQPGRPGGCLDAFEKEYWEQERKLTRSGDSGAVRQLREKFGKVLESADGSFAGIEHFLPYFYKEVVTLVDYLPAGALFLWMNRPG